jgi:hypothetical protein
VPGAVPVRALGMVFPLESCTVARRRGIRADPPERERPGPGRDRMTAQTAAATCGVIAFIFSSRASTSACRVATAGSDCRRGRGRSIVMSS